MLCLVRGRLANPDNAELHHLVDQRPLKFFVGHRLKLARTADLSTLDPLAAEHSLYLDRPAGCVVLATRHRSQAYR
jgi:hypothetical protein